MSDERADLIFTGGDVYTVDAARRWARAVAVSGGRIAAVGTDEQVRALAGPDTEVVELDGRMLLPGFQDAHCHPPGGGYDMLHCNLNDAYRLEEYEEIITAYADSHPGEAWIVGGGWSMDVFPRGNPTKDVLDRLVPDRPVCLPSRDGHSIWVNSKALEIAAVTAETEDPADGWIVRTADGEPAGTLHEGAMQLINEHIPDETKEDWIVSLRLAQEYLH